MCSTAVVARTTAWNQTLVMSSSEMTGSPSVDSRLQYMRKEVLDVSICHMDATDARSCSHPGHWDAGMHISRTRPSIEHRSRTVASMLRACGGPEGWGKQPLCRRRTAGGWGLRGLSLSGLGRSARSRAGGFGVHTTHNEKEKSITRLPLRTAVAQLSLTLPVARQSTQCFFF